MTFNANTFVVVKRLTLCVHDTMLTLYKGVKIIIIINNNTRHVAIKQSSTNTVRNITLDLHLLTTHLYFHSPNSME